MTNQLPREKKLAVGLMSGTSADGVTAALVEFAGKKIRVVRCRTYPYAARLQKRVWAAKGLDAGGLSRLNFELGLVFARAALRIMEGRRPDVIGSHGQTVWHGADDVPRNTLQIAEPSVIAEQSNVAVVADFRPRDVASGGQGAPLVAALDEFLFSQGPLRAVFNIGGIANVSFVGRGRLWSSFDTGPGNALLDLAVRLATSGRQTFDRGGLWARRGRVDEAKVRQILRQPYFGKAPPKSLDKSAFGEEFLRRHFGKVNRNRLANTAATLTEVTARSMAIACQEFAPTRPLEAVVSGGGAKNRFLMRRLTAALGGISVVTSRNHGIGVMEKEAVCFAWLALRAVSGKSNNCPQATGARGRRILGKIVPVL
jgi:anhydro-N-acetylmuramic acid kinase